MRKRKKTPKKEKSAMSVSLYGNLFFVICELAMAIYTGSQAVLLDAVYDGIEFFMLLPSIFLIPLLYQPANEKHPFGYLQLETIFLVLKGVTMTAVTIGLVSNNLHLLLSGGRTVAFTTAAYFELFACVLGILVTIYLSRKNRGLDSPLIDAECLGWEIDSIISLGMTLAFFLPRWIPFAWFQPLVPYLDPLITVVLSVIMLPAPIKTVVTALRDLMLIPPEEETVQDIKNTVDPLLADCRHTELSYEIVRTGRKLWISVYMTLDRDEISLYRLTMLQNRCIEELAKTYPEFDFELLPILDLDQGTSPQLCPMPRSSQAKQKEQRA